MDDDHHHIYCTGSRLFCLALFHYYGPLKTPSNFNMQHFKQVLHILIVKTFPASFFHPPFLDLILIRLVSL